MRRDGGFWTGLIGGISTVEWYVMTKIVFLPRVIGDWASTFSLGVTLSQLG